MHYAGHSSKPFTPPVKQPIPKKAVSADMSTLKPKLMLGDPAKFTPSAAEMEKKIKGLVTKAIQGLADQHDKTMAQVQLIADIRAKAKAWEKKVAYPGWYMVNKHMSDEEILTVIGKCTTVASSMEALSKRAVVPFLELKASGKWEDE